MAVARLNPSSRKNREVSPPDQSETETLNFKVTTEFKREYKGYAVSQGMTMIELLKEGFELTRQKRSRK